MPPAVRARYGTRANVSRPNNGVGPRSEGLAIANESTMLGPACITQREAEAHIPNEAVKVGHHGCPTARRVDVRDGQQSRAHSLLPRSSTRRAQQDAQ
eukprot:4700110-Prymnesium_polylepis.1